MIEISVCIQIIVALTILNVWFFRANKKTKFRGSTSQTLSEEFENYGLSKQTFLITSVVKPSLAITMLIALYFPILTKPTAFALSVFMAGALYMHFRVRDDFARYLPALGMFCGCVAIFLLS
jgi:uncharacterized membrane protein YphA (DoxX/SURF4 family)